MFCFLRSLSVLLEQKTPATRKAKEGSKTMNEKLRKWTALAVVLVTLLTGSAAYGEDHGSCYEAYLQRGLDQQQLTFDQFHGRYGDALCAPDGDALVASHQSRLSQETR
jgi:hypothetical protein